MIARCLQLFTCLALLALVAGVPTQASAHGGHVHANPSKPFETAQKIVAHQPAAAKSHSLNSTSDHSNERSQHVGGGSCCCSSAGCQTAATLPSQADEAPRETRTLYPPYGAVSLPRRIRDSLEHPPKIFA